jgi:hypothetical protein
VVAENEGIERRRRAAESRQPAWALSGTIDAALAVFIRKPRINRVFGARKLVQIGAGAHSSPVCGFPRVGVRREGRAASFCGR